MFNVIHNEGQTRAQHINQARAIAWFIAKKHNIVVTIACALGAYEDEYIIPPQIACNLR